MADYFLGLDLGQMRDYTALAVVGLPQKFLEDERRLEGKMESLEAARRHPHMDAVDIRVLEREVEREFGEAPLPPLPPLVYQVVHLERMPLHTPYPEVTRRVLSLMEREPLQGNADLVVDATGVGLAVVDLLRSAGLDFGAVTITAGEKQTTTDGRNHRVPKADLISRAQVLLQNRRLKIAPALPEAQTLIGELLNFRYKITPSANLTYEAWRENQHDDLLFALCLAVWAADRRAPPVDETLAGAVEPLGDEPLYTLDEPP